MSGFGTSGNTVSVSGDSAPYTLQWEPLTTHITIGTGPQLSNDQYCGGFSQYGAGPGMTGVSSITLPNGKSYQFSYDPTYGLLNKIVYPTGGYVSYSWGVNTASDIVWWADSMGSQNACAVQYSAPAILHRYVSYDGVNIAQQQDFTYATTWQTSGVTWSSKTTTVKTTDFLRPGNPITYTVYTYQSNYVGDPPNINTVVANQVPQEKTATYENGTGATLRTVTKAWNGFLDTSEQTALENGQTSQTNYTYQTSLAVLLEKDEYDFGSGAPGALLRKTVNNYQSFPVTPLSAHIWDRPCQTVVYDGQGNRDAETDYLYDTGTTVCGTAPTPALSGTGSYTGHDETLYGTSATVPRGNATTKTVKCFAGATACTDAVTKYIYDETGQITSSTDPNGNTTQYSFADHYTGGSPPGNTNAYLTTLTHPTVKGVTTHGYYQYDYPSGQLSVSQDDNNFASGTSTAYAYVDPFARPTQVNYPDGGLTSYTYNDSPYNASTPSPSVTTTTEMNSGNKVTTAAFDGLGHTVETILNTTPNTTYTNTTYDGIGRPYKVYNPFYSGNDSTYGFTTFVYDGLGRTCLVVPPDVTSVPTSCPTSAPAGDVFTSYSGNCSTVTDEAGKSRKSCSDGLGRMTGVWEDPNNLNYETDYTYDALDDLLTVNQKGDNSAPRMRSFTYDSLLRLLSAANPESGTVSYVYDPNGNVTTKTAPKPNQTGTATVVSTYLYDALNRITSKSYNDNSTPPEFFYYDAAPPHLFSCNNCWTNPVGRLMETVTGTGP